MEQMIADLKSSLVALHAAHADSLAKWSAIRSQLANHDGPALTLDAGLALVAAGHAMSVAGVDAAAQ